MRAFLIATAVLITPVEGKTLPKDCEIALQNLNDQDEYIKGALTGTQLKLATKKIQAAGAVGFFKGNLSLLPVICPAQMFSTVESEVRQRIDQLDQFIETGRWLGPAPNQN